MTMTAPRFLFLALAGVIGASAVAQSTDAEPREVVIWSDRGDGLEPPRLWDCTRIAPEYSRWLEDGNAPESWKYAGKTYRENGEARQYDWPMWIDWYEDSCGAALVPESNGLALGKGVKVGLIAHAVAFAGWAILRDGDDPQTGRPPPNDSPG